MSTKTVPGVINAKKLRAAKGLLWNSKKFGTKKLEKERRTELLSASDVCFNIGMAEFIPRNQTGLPKHRSSLAIRCDQFDLPDVVTHGLRKTVLLRCIGHSKNVFVQLAVSGVFCSSIW